ncbi:MAG: hypothetical protein ACKVXR_17825 [Planctomycetota bacterium]
MTTPRKKTAKSRDIEETETASTSALRADEMPPDVIEFMTAMDDYKRRHGRPFPNWSEVLQVVKSLGYCRKSA